MRVLVPALTTLVFLLLPTLAHACAVCFESNDEARIAFINTTAFLTFLPLGIIGIGGFLIYRIYKKAAKSDAEARNTRSTLPPNS